MLNRKQRMISKGRFVKRGVYFVLKGENKGCFLLHLTELSTDTVRVLAQFPEGVTVEMTPNEIREAFKDDYFDFVKTIPKKIYKVCLAQHQHTRNKK